MVLIIVPELKFNNKEFKSVTKNLNEKKIPFRIASTSTDKATGYISKEFNNKPMEIYPDLLIKDILVTEYSAFILIGGSGNKLFLWNNIDLHKKLQKAFKNNILIAAICLAPICLINSGILKSFPLTAYKTKEILELFSKSGNIYIDAEVCLERNIITANGPKASNSFSNAIIEYLKKLNWIY